MKPSNIKDTTKDIAYKAVMIPYISAQPSERMELIMKEDWRALAIHDAKTKLWLCFFGLLFLAPIFIFIN